ncbi:MAG: hypothetical protein PHD60_11830 [Clostridia bacterium]|nr:hypothetical protein [Clostridia bacterium]
MFKTLESKQASGEILLFYEWEEDQAGYNDERVTQNKLKVSPDGDILLCETNEYISFAPNSGGKQTDEKIYTIPVNELIELIKDHCRE